MPNIIENRHRIRRQYEADLHGQKKLPIWPVVHAVHLSWARRNAKRRPLAQRHANRCVGVKIIRPTVGRDLVSAKQHRAQVATKREEQKWTSTASDSWNLVIWCEHVRLPIAIHRIPYETVHRFRLSGIDRDQKLTKGAFTAHHQSN